MNKIEEFRKLHQQVDPLLVGNVWDTRSALVCESAGNSVIGTSSAAIADNLGYADGEQMSFEELLLVVKAILRNTSVPLTVDIEGGYSREVAEVTRNLKQLVKLGVVGVNIEDSVVDGNGTRSIVDVNEVCHLIEQVKRNLAVEKFDVFMNVRTDHFIMGLDNPVEETIRRAHKYEKAGADGLFAPCIIGAGDIKKVVASTKLPLNVMAVPGLPSFAELKRLGVKRISAGPFIYEKVKKGLIGTVEDVVINQSFSTLFN